jgi:hypothetical protein
MIRGGFLSPRQRAELIALLRDGRTEQRLARRANAVLLLDDGWSCERAAKALYLDDDTIRGWRKTYDEAGVEGLRRFEAAPAFFPRRKKRNWWFTSRKPCRVRRGRWACSSNRCSASSTKAAPV